MAETHQFSAKVTWTGAAQGPTRGYESYSREYTVEIAGKPPLKSSSDPAYRGDPGLHNPEDMLIAALSGCHLLSYLALCAKARVDVVAYRDDAGGTMAVRDKRMRFIEVVLRPKVTIAAGGDVAKAQALHEKAHEVCFIANSVNFPVRHEAEISLAGS